MELDVSVLMRVLIFGMTTITFYYVRVGKGRQISDKVRGVQTTALCVYSGCGHTVLYSHHSLPCPFLSMGF